MADDDRRKALEDFELHGASELGAPKLRDFALEPALGVRVMADYGSSGLWEVDSSLVERGMIPHDALRLPSELSSMFDEWIDRYWASDREPESFDFAGFNSDGRKLATDVKRHVGDRVRVVYRPVGDDRGDDESVVLTG